MSVEAVAWALGVDAPDATSKLVLIALADSANRDDRISWLSQSTLADVAMVAQRRTVSAALDRLVEAGLIREAEPGDFAGRRHDDWSRMRYRPKAWVVLLDEGRAQRTPADDGGRLRTIEGRGQGRGQGRGEGRGQGRGEGRGLERAQTENREPLNREPKTHDDDVPPSPHPLPLIDVLDPDRPDPFDRFWNAVPRRVGKGAARKAWRAAIRKADPDTIVAAMEAFAEAHRRAGTPTEYVPHPSTWLNAERWDDDLDAAVTDRNGRAGPVMRDSREVDWDRERT